MKPKTQKFLFRVSYAFIAVTFLGMFIISSNYETRRLIALPASIYETILQQRKTNATGSVSPILKPFVYLMQTEQCLPDYLYDKQQIGKPEECKCDVKVFSYKKQCLDKNKTAVHIEYLYKVNSSRISWSAGRNWLYSASRTGVYRYHYYIFMDDDIIFSYNKANTPSWMRSVSPLRSFENFLLEYEPAVGVTNYKMHHNSDTILKKIKKLCKSVKNITKTDQNDTKRNQTVTDSDVKRNHSLYVPAIHFDASVNAFHNDAIDHILPYPTDFDHINWWHSQRYVIAATELKFRGQCYLFKPVDTDNPKHREYPRDRNNTRAIWASFAEKIVRGIPYKYQNITWIKTLIKNPEEHIEKSLAVCWKLPIRFHIKPYLHFSFSQA